MIPARRKKIVTEINNAAPGTEWAVGTEANLVGRIIQENPDKKNRLAKSVYVPLYDHESN